MNIDALMQSDLTLESAQIFLINVEAKREFSFGVWTSRQHLFLKVTAKGYTGWGEEIISLNKPDLDLSDWANKLKQLEGMPLKAMWQHMKPWHNRQREMTEMALIDLFGKINGIHACELFELHGTSDVPGLYCILEQDPNTLYEKAVQAAELGYRTHLKIKLFGDTDIDLPLIEAAKRAIPQVYLVGDANNGYRTELSEDAVNDIADGLNALKEAGLHGCEDPANMDPAQWKALQKSVQPLSLIPDAPMRPASKSIDLVGPDMSDMFNIHPGSMASIIDAVALIKKINSFGGKIMIGDNSLVGPACTVWQQIAVGCGAEFVEALEKEAEFPQYMAMIQSCNTSVEQGKVQMTDRKPGFGLELDESKLLAEAKTLQFIF